MKNSIQTLTIGRLAKRAGVGIDTVRFYERAGLLPAPVRTAAGYRTYTRGDVDRMRFIRQAKALGFTLDEIGELLALSAGRGSRADVKAIAQTRLRDLETKIKQLTVVRDTLAHYASGCSGQGPVAGCPIIEAVLANIPPTLEH